MYQVSILLRLQFAQGALTEEGRVGKVAIAVSVVVFPCWRIREGVAVRVMRRVSPVLMSPLTTFCF
jgi:hypothetical protein